jgi:mannose-6-phosphate isomerase-like protein (cupin superfamily)
MINVDIVKTDKVADVTAPINYNVKNPVIKLMKAMEESSFFAEDRGAYLADSLQYLFPFSNLELYGPAGSDHTILNPELQDNKTDFQKQNIKDFTLTDQLLVRGWVTAGQSTIPFLKFSYSGDPDSYLSRASGHKLTSYIYLWASIQGKMMKESVRVPYNESTNRYEIEIWGYTGMDLKDKLGLKGKEALTKGLIISRPDLVTGSITDFAREGLDNLNMYDVSPQNTMHPIRPLNVSVAWTDHTKTCWDSNNGNNYNYSFDMILRGWNNFMQAGVSGNPHGGIGFLHYRNLLSNYKPYTRYDEMARPLQPWMFDANGKKGNQQVVKEEEFVAVEYVDLHILKPECAIGIHRHRDNQEIFFLLTGKAYMVMGDWNKFPGRERAFEIRTLLPGSFTLLKAGQLHALVNALDIDASLLMFGGYD